MLIRVAVPEDIRPMMTLAGQSESAAHWSAREYDALFAPEAPERVALVACAEPGGIAGFVIARCGVEWEIENVVVDERMRQRGIGRLLIQEVIRGARERGATDVFLEVRESNAAARGLYANTGFKEVGRRAWYYQNLDEDALVLRLLL